MGGFADDSSSRSQNQAAPGEQLSVNDGSYVSVGIKIISNSGPTSVRICQKDLVEECAKQGCYDIRECRNCRVSSSRSLAFFQEMRLRL